MTDNKIQQIRKKLYLLRDGASSSSMRSKGLDYKMNWGTPVTSLRNLSKEYYPDNELAGELWKQDTRELRILATLIADPALPADEIEKWEERIDTIELAEQAVLNFFSKLPDAPAYAARWIQSDNAYLRLAGFLLYIRLFMHNYRMTGQEEQNYLTIAVENIGNSELSLNSRIVNSFYYLIRTDEEYRDKLIALIPELEEHLTWNL